MELPKPPQDIELRNIIDKLAQFVARNGPDFEQMTKNKQKGNPKFSFLFGGEHYNYYQYKVTTEQAIHKQRDNRDIPPNQSAPQVRSGNMGASNTPNPMMGGWMNMGLPLHQISPTLDAISQQQASLHEQTAQSAENLNAQHMVLLQQQQVQTEEAIRKNELENLLIEADDLGINLSELDAILQPIIDTCTKDSISQGKAWILHRATSTNVNNLLARYLLQKLLEPDRKFIHKLHIIYLVNDILHHCARKHTEEFKLAIEKVVVPMFCNTSLDVTEEQQAKLSKLLGIWENKNHYFSEDIVQKLKDPVNSWAQYKAELIQKNPEIVNRVANNTKSTFAGFQSQHLAFVSHTLQQIQSLEQQKQALEAQKMATQAPGAPPQHQPPPPPPHHPQPPAAPPLPPPPSSHHQQLPQPHSERHIYDPPPPGLGGGPEMPQSEYQNPPPPPPSQQGPPPPLDDHPPLNRAGGDGPPPVFELGINVSQPPPGFMFPPPPGGIELPDLTRPPPGFPPVTTPAAPEVQPEDLLPSLPYYDLPAGLMVPLIKLEDSSYKPLDPDSIRLPPPAPPSDRLLAAVKSFYSPPGHEQPRDSDGWEKLGLYEYFRAKSSARKRKEIEIEEGLRERSRSPSPVKSFHDSGKSPPPKRRYSSRSRSRSREKSSKSSRRRRERSKSPPSATIENRENRSPTPPSFMGLSFGGGTMEERLAENNKGHQMLKKMGWTGAGLGVKEQGIETPIVGGDIRDRTDQYKGVGVNLNDPYENFRKSKGQAFITRMKARAEERS